MTTHSQPQSFWQSYEVRFQACDSHITSGPPAVQHANTNAVDIPSAINLLNGSLDPGSVNSFPDTNLNSDQNNTVADHDN